MINGDRRRTMSFATLDQLFGPSEVEAIEIFPRTHTVPFAYGFRESGCGRLVVWFRNP